MAIHQLPSGAFADIPDGENLQLPSDAFITSAAEAPPAGGVTYTQLERGIRGVERGLAMGGY